MEQGADDDDNLFAHNNDDNQSQRDLRALHGSRRDMEAHCVARVCFLERVREHPLVVELFEAFGGLDAAVYEVAFHAELLARMAGRKSRGALAAELRDSS